MKLKRPSTNAKLFVWFSVDLWLHLAPILSLQPTPVAYLFFSLLLVFPTTSSGSISTVRRITVASVVLLVILKLSVLRLLEAYILWLSLNIRATVPGMSSTSFDSPRVPPTSARFEIRRSSLTGPATYEVRFYLICENLLTNPYTFMPY